MIRVGAGLYGLVENKEYKDQFLKVFSLYAKVLQIKHIDQGCSIGYNNSFVAKKNMTIAILGIGYADGLNPYTKYFTYVNNKKCEFIGKMSMNRIESIIRWLKDNIVENFAIVDDNDIVHRGGDAFAWRMRGAAYADVGGHCRR